MTTITKLTDNEVLALLRLRLAEPTTATSIWPDSELWEYLTRGNLKAFAILIRAGENDRITTTTHTTTVQTTNTQTFALPTDYYKTENLWLQDSSGEPLDPPIQYVRRREYKTGRSGFYIKADTTGAFRLVLVYPSNIPAGDVYLHEYYQLPDKIDGTGSNIVTPIGHEDVVIQWAAYEAMASRGDDVTQTVAAYQEALSRFERDIANRYMGRKYYIRPGLDSWDMYSAP